MKDITEKLREYAQYAETQFERETFEASIKEITVLREENARLRAALHPFAERADRWDGQPERQILVMLSECRAAAAAIREGGKNG